MKIRQQCAEGDPVGRRFVEHTGFLRLDDFQVLAPKLEADIPTGGYESPSEVQ